MKDGDRFGVFTDEVTGPMCREFFQTLEQAETAAQRITDTEQIEVFIYQFDGFKEVGRFHPTPKPAKRHREDTNQTAHRVMQEVIRKSAK